MRSDKKRIFTPPSNQRRASQDDLEEDPNANEKEDETIKGKSLQDIMNAHKEHALENMQFDTAKDFMKEVMFSVPLHKLYKVIGSCNYNEDALFCPVLVEIIDPEVLIKNNNFKFLL